MSNRQKTKDGQTEGAVSTVPNNKPITGKYIIETKMYKVPKMQKTSIVRNESYVSEPIEKKIQRVVNNKEPIKDGAPLLYTERKDGVRPEYDIRTDRWEIAIEAMDKVDKSHKAKREQRQKTLGEQGREGQIIEGDGIPTGE